MRVLVTGSETVLAGAVLAALGGEHGFECLDAPDTGRLGWLERSEGLHAALAGVETVLHLAPLRVEAADPHVALEVTTRGTYRLLDAALDAGVSRIVLGSSLDLFDRLPARWDVTEQWRPRPEPQLAQLCPWLAELSAREVTRTAAATTVCLRFGRLVDDAALATQPSDPRWLHLADAVEAVRRALAYRCPGWSVFHITAAGPLAKVRLAAAGEEPFGYRPRHDLMAGRQGQQPPTDLQGRYDSPDPFAPVSPIASRPIRRVVLFGAGGPMGAVAAAELAATYRLRLTDRRPLAEIAAEGPRMDQPPGAPVVVPLESPHECLVVDVTNPEAVMDACAGMDAIVNCTVIRYDPVDAFRVNTLGAYNIARAAAAHGIRRVVQTGPQLSTLHGDGDYSADYDIPADVPPRPGRHLYGHSKYLGQEILRVFAGYHGLEVPVLLFNGLLDPGLGTLHAQYPFAISWPDTGRAIRCALEVPTLPSPYEVVHLCADLPHGRIDNRKAKELLGWQPRDDLAGMWIGG